MIRIGQIGIGHNHAEGKMTSVRKYPELFEVIGICENNPETLKTKGLLSCYKGLPIMDEMQILEACDAILVECDINNLTSTALRCIVSGKHIHMDKPASGTLDEYRQLLSLAKSKDLIVQLGYMYRYNPAIKKCLQLIRDKTIGDIYSINAEMSTCHTPLYKEWVSQFNGGIMRILGCHLIDLIVFILGEPLHVHSFLRSTGKDGVYFPDNNQAILEYENTLARINVSSVEVNGWGRRQFVINGSNASVEIKPLENPTIMKFSDVHIANSEYENMATEVDLKDTCMDNRYDDMMKDFYAYIQGTKINPYSYDHEYCVQKVLLQLCTSDDYWNRPPKIGSP